MSGVVQGSRDGWCTPQWLTDLLPLVDLDPCSNSRSTVRAREVLSLENGTNGLLVPWYGLVYVNGPFSNLLPWVSAYRNQRRKLTGAGFLVNQDSSTAWWQALIECLPLRLDFSKRIQFVPPEGITPSTNSKPQALICDEVFWRACSRDLSKHGTLWMRCP